MSVDMIIVIAQALVKYGPAVARSIRDIFTKANPTIEDWEAVFALSEKSYDDYVKKD